MSNTQTAIAIRDDMSLGQLGDMLAKSGYFTDARDAAQCVVKVLAGRELGFGPVASMTGVYIVKGKVSLSANLMAAAVRRSGRYTFKVNTLTPTACEIEFFEVMGGKRESLGVSAFTLADAQKAGTQNLDKFARNMLYARAMSNGVKWFCPDVTGGPIYTPEELGERVNEDGEIIDAQPVKPAPYVAPAPTGAISTPGGIVSAPIPATNGHKAPADLARADAVYAAADWLKAHPLLDNANDVAALKDWAAATGWVKPDGIHKSGDARQAFANYISEQIVKVGLAEATAEAAQ
jgi:hypothetical protein